MKELLYLLPDAHREQMNGYLLDHMEEFRMCVGQPLIVRTNHQETIMWPSLQPTHLEQALQVACRHSIYSHMETLRQGFVTLPGGHRMGVCGFGVTGHDGTIQTIRNPSSLLVRIAREFPGCSAGIGGRICASTLIIGPPCSGKTTLLRDLICFLSDQRKQRIGIADERSELSAALHGVPQLKIGMRTDVLLNIPKSEALLMLLRTMNPQWLAVDEITAPKDIEALSQCAYCGVKLLATAHADCMEDLWYRPLYRSLMECKIFKWIVQMQQDKSFVLQEVPE